MSFLAATAVNAKLPLVAVAGIASSFLSCWLTMLGVLIEPTPLLNVAFESLALGFGSNNKLAIRMRSSLCPTFAGCYRSARGTDYGNDL